MCIRDSYRSAESDIGVCAGTLEAMVRQGWAVRRDTLGGLRADLRAGDSPANGLAFTSKVTPDGGVPRRVVWDLR
eukprot:13963124-Alexandrium_andersonii.AAC.1